MHLNWGMPLGGALAGTLPNPSLSSDSVLQSRAFASRGLTPQLSLYNANVNFNYVTAATGRISGTLQVTGLVNPAAGAGVEIAYSAGIGYVIAYDRSGAVYKDISIGGATFSVGISGTTKLSVDANGDTTGARQVNAGTGLVALGVNAVVTASSSVMDYSSGLRIVAVGPNASTNAAISLLSVRSDSSNVITVMSSSVTGAVTFPVTLQPGAAGGYLAQDASPGISTTITSGTLVGKTITVKDGLITGFA